MYCPQVSQDHFIIPRLNNLLYRKFHGAGWKETGLFFTLTTLPVFAAAMSRSVCLHKSRDLQYIHIGRSHSSLITLVNICNCRNTEMFYFTFSSDLQCLLVANSCKRISLLSGLPYGKISLKIYGILSLSVMETIFSAMRSAISSPSMAHGPAIKKKLPWILVF